MTEEVKDQEEVKKVEEKASIEQKPNHEDHKGKEPKKEPRRFKKELVIDHDLYQYEVQQALKKGVESGYSQALNGVIKYLKNGKPIKDCLKGLPYNPLWEHVLGALGREDEWKEFVIEQETEGN